MQVMLQIGVLFGTSGSTLQEFCQWKRPFRFRRQLEGIANDIRGKLKKVSAFSRQSYTKCVTDIQN